MKVLEELEEIEVVEYHSHIVRPVKKVLVEVLRAKDFLNNLGALTHRNHMEDLV